MNTPWRNHAEGPTWTRECKAVVTQTSDAEIALKTPAWQITFAKR